MKKDLELEYEKRKRDILAKMLKDPKAGPEWFKELDTFYRIHYGEERWGVGNRKDEKAFDTVMVGNDEYELIHGEHPHSRQDNTFYARSKNGSITGFDGHRMPFKIEIEEYNYYKSSGLSGNEIRKGGKVKLFVKGVQVLDEFVRSYERGFHIVNQFIADMEMNWGWFPHDCQKEIGRVVAYKEQLFKIESFVVSQAAVMLQTLDGKPRKRFMYEDLDKDIYETGVKVCLTDSNLCWYPEYEGNRKK